MTKCIGGDRYQQFWWAGHGTKIKQIPLDDFAAKYASGELAAKAAVKA